MIRMILALIALMAVPFLAYFIYKLAFAGPEGKASAKPWNWERDSFLNVGFIGLFLATIGLVYLLFSESAPNEGKYIPARIENGKLIDGRFNTETGAKTDGTVIK